MIVTFSPSGDAFILSHALLHSAPLEMLSSCHMRCYIQPLWECFRPVTCAATFSPSRDAFVLSHAWLHSAPLEKLSSCHVHYAEQHDNRQHVGSMLSDNHCKLSTKLSNQVTDDSGERHSGCIACHYECPSPVTTTPPPKVQRSPSGCTPHLALTLICARCSIV